MFQIWKISKAFCHNFTNLYQLSENFYGLAFKQCPEIYFSESVTESLDVTISKEHQYPHQTLTNWKLHHVYKTHYPFTMIAPIYYYYYYSTFTIGGFIFLMNINRFISNDISSRHFLPSSSRLPWSFTFRDVTNKFTWVWLSTQSWNQDTAFKSSWTWPWH